MINSLCKLALEHGGFVQELVIPAELSNGTGLTNPSLLVEDGKYILNLRHVQYSLYHSEGEQKYQTAWGPLTYFNPEDDITLRTVNYICELDPETLRINSYAVTDTSKLDVKPLWEFIGLEDARLVRWDGKLYQSGVRRDTTTNGVGRMELSEIVDNAEVSRMRIEPPADTYCEKNWMPILDLPYHYVKWTSSTEIVKVDLETKKANTVKIIEQPFSFSRDLRGGSQVIKYKNYYVALTHEVDLWKNYLDRKDAQYYHRFIVWDEDWNIKHYSEEFKFMTGRIEFSCGLAIHDNQMIIPFGFQDTTAFVLKFPIEVFEYLVGMSDGLEVHTVDKTDYLIESFIDFPHNDTSTHSLASRYYRANHYGSALSFYLRTAEYSSILNNIYASLIMIAKCLDKLGRRPHATLIAYCNAIAHMPNRPEGYLLVSKLYEQRKEYHQAYLNACIGLQHSKYCTHNHELEYPGEYSLYFQKAISAWQIGKKEEAVELFKYLIHDTNMSDDYRSIVMSNLNYIVGDKYKLDSIPVLNILSINEAEERRNNQEEEFKKYGLDKYKYHVYNRYDPNSYKLLGTGHEKLLPTHIGIAISHLDTIKHWLDTTDDEVGFFSEDDMSLETVQYWNFTWLEFYNRLPSDWEAVQLCLLSEVLRDIKFAERNLHDWGGQAYIMKRSYAEKLLNYHIVDGSYLLDIPGNPELTPCVEHVLFDGIGKVYNFPLFVESQETNSTYAGENNDYSTNAKSYKYVINWWKSNKLSIKELFTQ